MELTPWKGYTAVADAPQKFKEFIVKLKEKKRRKKPSVYEEKQLNYINKTNELITISVCFKSAGKSLVHYFLNVFIYPRITNRFTRWFESNIMTLLWKNQLLKRTERTSSFP